MEKEPQSQLIIEEISIETIDDAIRMRLASWLDTYVNDDLGITREWLEERNKDQLSDTKRQTRLERLNDPYIAGWVAKDIAGKVIGVTTPYIDENGVQHVGSLYVDKEWHGKGVGGRLMQNVIDWFDPAKQIELDVATYNERAKAFYRKWGFEEVPGSESLFANKIPEIKMIRPGTLHPTN